MATLANAREVTTELQKVRQARQYKPEAVPDDVIAELLEVARWTGSSRNTQPWHFIVITDKAQLTQISQVRTPINWVAEAPLAIAIVLDGANNVSEVYDEGRVTERLLIGARILGLGGGTAWFGEWLVADVLYAIAVAVAIGAAVGYGLAALAVRLRDRRLLSDLYDGWLAIPSVLAIYGLTEIAGAYGFIAAFVGGVAFRRYEHSHESHVAVHEGAEVVEKFGELAVVLLLGSMLTISGLGAPGVEGWLLVPALLLVIRPLSVFAAMVGHRIPAGERSFVAWFGVRGVGSLYYAAIAVGSGVLAAGEERVVVWSAIACILVSIVVHGITAAALSRRLLPPIER